MRRILKLGSVARISYIAATSAAIILFLLAPRVSIGQEDVREAGGTPDFLYEVRRGDTFMSIAKFFYSSEHYYILLMLHNRIERPENLKAGESIRAPEFKTIFEGEPLNDFFGDEVKLILTAREKYIAVEKRLWELHSADWSKRTVEMSDEIVTALEEAAECIETAYNGFGREKPEVVYQPRGLLSQQRSLADNLRGLAGGANDGYGYDLDMVHQRLALALAYGIKWGRSGFK